MTLLLSKLNLLRAGVATLALTLLASCGGGDQIEPFVPERVVAFGDEASLIEEDPGFSDDGRKYTVNGVERATDGTTLTSTRDCTRNPIWVQVVANDYGYQFAECLTTSTTARAFTRAQVNSTVAMMSARITAYMTSPGFTDKDLVTIMVGTYDVLAAAGQPTRDAALAAAAAAGTAAGAEVVRITDRGAKVIVATIPDVGVTPQGIASGQASLLSELTTAFNSALRIKLQDVRGGGHSAGLVLGDELVLMMRRAPANYGIVNTVDAACANALPNCDETDALLVTAARTNHASDWLWAGPLQLGANAQSRLGSAAVHRARHNPF
jgi:outer membrane lipase/esterase